MGDKKHLSFYIDLLSGMFFDYKFSDDWEKQKHIVEEEIKMRSANVWTPLYEEISRTLFPHSRQSFTWKDELKNISKAKLKMSSDIT